MREAEPGLEAPIPPPAPRPGRARTLALLAGGALLAGAAMFVAGFAAFAAHVASLDTPASPPRADAIIVLTGGQARLDAALDLLKAGKGKRLLISGVHPSAGSRSLQAVTGGDAALFDCCVDIDHAALDTIGNAAESARWIERHRYGSVILVTNNYHIPRSLLEIRRLIRDADLTAYPVVNTKVEGLSWIARDGVLPVLGLEYVKYLAALARSALPPPPPSAPTRLAERGPVAGSSAALP